MTRRSLIPALVAALALVGCSDAKEPSPAPSSGPKTVRVFAASSLTEVFTKIGKDYEAANVGTKVTFTFTGNAATQVNQGAPADVFTSAAPADMTTVVEAGNADGPATTFVRNQLVIAVAKGNPKGIKRLADLAKSGVKVALCAEHEPCGASARKALDGARVKFSPAALEQDPKAALSKVKLGQVDAALVFRTDVKAAASDVDGVEFAESAKAVNDYAIVVLRNAPNKAGGRAFAAYVLSDKGKAVLTAAGFQLA